MSDIAIRVENLGKQYKIGRLQKRHDTLRDKISDLGFSIFDFKKSSNGHNQKSEIINQKSSDTIWALKDVSFEVKRGEVVGIIGRNGAGKSTLLKILSRITEPTEGGVDIYGRIASLLEVGTGFHPELTGRENIFLNGAILGMRKAEIKKKFDEIVAFAEVEKFIDTPVKRYSSGMYVRLAFAVAAHLEPEILLVDEVLAVGDAAFQDKSLGKMSEVAGSGRTVLFVSHNMMAVQSICSRAILLANGNIMANDSSAKAIDRYMEAQQDQVERTGPGSSHELVLSGAALEISATRFYDSLGKLTNIVEMGEDFIIEVEYFAQHRIDSPVFTFGINHGRLGCLSYISMFIDKIGPSFINGRGTVRCRIHSPLLVPGIYHVWAEINSGGLYNQMVSWQQLVAFKIIGGTKFFGDDAMVDLVRAGALYMPHTWDWKSE